MRHLINGLSVLFVALGLYGVFLFGYELYQSHLSFSTYLLYLPAGIGLLFRKEFWRQFSVFLLSVCALIALALGILLLGSGYLPGFQELNSVATSLSAGSTVLIVSFLIAFLTINVLGMWLLSRKDVRVGFHS